MIAKAIRSVVVIVILVGAYHSLSAGSKLRQLKQENRQLLDQAGDLRIGDPDKVHLVAIRDAVPRRGVDEAIVGLWKYRIYYPAGYQRNRFLRTQRVSADTPRATSSGSSSYNHTPLPEPEYETLILSVIRSERGWDVSRMTGDSSGMSSVSDQLDFDDPDALVIEPVVRPGDGTVSFAADEPICVLRVRGKEPVESRGQTDDEPLYPGFYYYLVPEQAKDSFEAQMRGQVAP